MQFPACLHVIGYLYRMEIFNEIIATMYVQTRDIYLQNILSHIPNELCE